MITGKIVIETNTSTFDILGYYYKGNDGKEYFHQAYYGTNILDPAIGYWDFEDYNGEQHCFVDYDETVEKKIERLNKFSTWEIVSQN